MFQNQKVPIHFLKHGPYLGALGCVINSVDQFLRPPSEVAASNEVEATAAETEQRSKTKHTL